MEDEKPQMSWDAEKGTVTLVKDDKTRTFDINNEEDRTQFLKLSQRGWYYDEDASKELGQLRKIINNWDNAIEAAKKDDEAMGQLVNKLEGLIGRPLTGKEKREMSKGDKPQILYDEEENEKLLETIGSLEEKIKKLERSQVDKDKQAEEKELEEIKRQINSEAERLEKKFPGGKNIPKFDRQEIFQFAYEKGIDDLELAFKMKYFDKLTEASKKEALEELKKQKKQRNEGFVETGDETPEIPDFHTSKNSKTYHHLGKNALKSAKEEGLNLFTDD